LLPSMRNEIAAPLKPRSKIAKQNAWRANRMRQQVGRVDNVLELVRVSPARS
jgi:hypothetical protein